MTNFFVTIGDIGVMIKRNLIRIMRLPQLIVFSIVQPVIFVLLFAYVFGSVIKIPGFRYIEYLLPGILVQTVLFGAMQTGIGLADDLSRGLTDRFKSLPMARSAVLTGRTVTDLIRNFFVILLMIFVGYLIGFRFENGFFHAVEAILLVLLFGFSFSWISATIGLFIKNIETTQVVGFIWIFPLAFISSVFVPIQSMTKTLYYLAKVNPVTFTVNTARALLLGGPINHDLFWAIIWMIGILALFIPISVTKYRSIE